jgi:histidinol-phosphate phosphatase family protein
MIEKPSDDLRRAVFIDKDGTLIENRPHNVDPRRVVFPQGSFAALQRLAAAGYLIVVVSNQPGIALRRFDRAALDALAHWLKERLADAGVALAGFYACPHAPPATGMPACNCRKPNPGLLLRAAQELNIALDQSWMIGDILDDVEAGQRAGCRTVLLDVGNETEWQQGTHRTPTLRARTLAEAALLIVAGERLAAQTGAAA